MAIIGDALRQAFMPKHEYESLREEEKAWGRLQRPLLMFFVTVVWFAVIVSAFASLKIVFPADDGSRSFCHTGDRRIQAALPMNATRDPDRFPGAFYLTEEEAADYYWMVVFVPSAIVFFASVVYLFAGGVRCLSILNTVFAVIFALLAMFLGSSLLTLGSSCSSALFWCYEIASWGLVILYGGTAFFLRRKAAVILDESDFAGRNLGLEMLEAPPEVTPEIERRVNEGFKAWMGSSLLSSDEEDGPDDYLEAYSIQVDSSHQRV
ncbi:uncharacterized protein LOC131257004 isoform X2 [Magnolia sinica]|uniref:uncharacterized protein LOC131257004 isoform X2 n=1 Tax=Magnolia sinica TaxID=86752 RepID=UPI00265B68F5|nr:uncharacterized protein LOC131257004 isoform X2 [Magnolia sinica]